MKKRLLKVNGHNLHISEKIDNLLNNYQSFYTPPKEDVFKAYELCSFNETKVVIIGQDPYPTVGFANGLCFSVNPECEIPKSLKNIYNSLERELNIVKQNGDLTSWSKQGVLLINSVLTNEIGSTNAHKNIGWEFLTENVIIDLSNRGKIIFVLLGNYAKQYKKFIDLSNNKVLETSHPSPLGAYRGFNTFDLFTKINKELKYYNYKEIKW